MVKISFVLCVLAFFAFAGVNCASHQNAPAPAVDCSTIIFSMADCLTFVTNGSKVTKPEGGCCSGLKTVLKTDAECLCETFKNSGSLGVVLNITKALSLPSACGVSAPSISKCGLSVSPGAAPDHSPKSSSPSPKSLTPVSPAPAQAPGSTTAGSQVASPAPAPAPASSDASAFSISFVPLLVTLIAAWCSIV